MQVIAERTLTRLDHVRLTRLLPQASGAAAAALRELLDGSDQVDSPAVAPTVATMYSTLLLEDAGGGEPARLTLCYPADAEPASGFISVLSPVGIALLGLRLGELARWRTPDGQDHAARIVGMLFQPEATGDYTT
jgi:regulator of nucleoside diphosphate kinase